MIGGIYTHEAALLAMRGEESLDFLHRLSTNDMNSLRKGEYRSTVLTNEKGRIIDLITVFHLGDSLLLLCSPGNSARVRLWLTKYTITEEIEIINITSYCISYLIKIIKVNNSINTQPDPAVRVFTTDSPEPSAAIHFNPEGMRKSATCILYASMKPPEISESGELTQITEQQFDGIRIEHGIPRFGSELTLDMNPLEAGLRDFISFTKGCYIGQEVIARIDTYDKQQKRMVGIIAGDAGHRTLSPGRLMNSLGEIGMTTSHAWSDTLARTIALGFIKTNAPRADCRLEIGGTLIPAEIVDLPFVPDGTSS